LFAEEPEESTPKSVALVETTSTQEAQVIEELAEDLGARIYERKFEEAVSVIEEGGSHHYHSFIDDLSSLAIVVREKMEELDMENIALAQSEIDSRVKQLTSILTEMLEVISSSKSTQHSRSASLRTRA
jgi:hypothetical protein